MKKKLIAILLAVFSLVFCLSACDLGSYVENGGNNSSATGPESPETPETPETPSLYPTHYTLKVYYDNRPFQLNDCEITAVWAGDSVHRVALDKKGEADAGELDGTFTVYLEGLPEKYTYDPNGYVANNDERHLIILLTDVKEPVSGDGKNLYQNDGCYLVRHDGTYRAQIDREGDVRYYDYIPTASGRYSVTSWVNVYDDEINPKLDIYRANTQDKVLLFTVDDGGASMGGYTNNFRYECQFDRTEVGSPFCFAVRATSKSESYPIYVDFEIKYEGEFSRPVSAVREVRAKEAKYKAPNPKEGETFAFIDFETKIFDGACVKYNETTKRYHYYSMEKYGNNPFKFGAGFGPELFCAIEKESLSYPLTTLYNANAVGEFDDNKLLFHNMSILENGEVKQLTLDYTRFIRTDYKGRCNDDGVCYVTKELKEFLENYAYKNRLYSDGLPPDADSPGDGGYLSKNNGSWLFACGIYIPKGESPEDFRG